MAPRDEIDVERICSKQRPRDMAGGGLDRYQLDDEGQYGAVAFMITLLLYRHGNLPWG